MKKISLVTGGAGFIGSHLAYNLIKKGHTVVVVDDLSGGFKTNIPDNAFFENGSIINEKFLDKIFKKYNFDYCFHLAAYAAEGLSHHIRKFNYENNVLGSINLINRSVKHNIRHFVFTSSIAVYGANQTLLSEKTTPHPMDPYGIAKYAVELDLAAAYHMFGLNYTIFRPHNVYGEGQNYADPYRNVVGIFINNLLHGRPMTIFGDGMQTRAFTYITDVAPHIASSIDISGTKNQIFNIGADTSCSVLDLARLVAQEMGVKQLIKYLPPRYEQIRAISSHAKVKKIFRIKKNTDLKTGLQRMIAWAKKRPPMTAQIIDHIEIDKKMPTVWKKLIKTKHIV